MFADATEIENGTVLEADVCIVGSGPAGLAIAERLDGKVSCLLLESGGLEPDPAVQSLYQGTSVGRRYFPLDFCRQRFFGGSSNCWAGMCRPLEPEDFSARSWVPHSGWPFERSELEPYYEEAGMFLGLRGPGWHLPDWSRPPQSAWELDSRLGSTFFKLSAPIRLGQTMRGVLRESKGIRVVLGASLTRIGLSPNAARVNSLTVSRSKGGGGFTVRPRRVVLACGGIENARLLLCSDDVQRSGVGNEHDLVGRFFMEHFQTDESLLLGSPALPPTAFYRRTVSYDQGIWGCFMLSAETRAREGLLSAAIVLLPPFRRDPLIEPLRRAIADTDATNRPLPDHPALYTLGTPSEQSPNPTSRVTLDLESDALGMRRVRLDWRPAEIDQRSAARTHELFAEAIARAGLGRVKITLVPGDPFPSHMNGGCHHMGTTRMHDDPKRGVVDSNARVHGIANLYVAGSSVFPTAGSANPTLTLTALARRLAAHLAGP